MIFRNRTQGLQNLLKDTQICFTKIAKGIDIFLENEVKSEWLYHLWWKKSGEIMCRKIWRKVLPVGHANSDVMSYNSKDFSGFLKYLR